MRAATATAEPPLDPPGVRVRSHGFFDGPSAEFSVDEPIANSSRLVLPMTIAPAASSRSTTVALYGGMKPRRILDEAVVGTPAVHMLSFSAIGTPWSGPADRPAASSARARSSERSAITVLKADNFGSSCVIRASDCSHVATAVVSRLRICLASVVAVINLSRRSLGEGRSTDYARDFEETRFECRIRRVAEQLRPRQRRVGNIVAIDRAIENLGRRRYAGGIEPSNLFDVGQDVAQLARE